jgi:hypothetical protein
VELRGAYYNTKRQVSELETLLRKLPDPSQPLRPARRRRVPGTARRFGREQVDALIASYLAGATVYQLA